MKSTILVLLLVFTGALLTAQEYGEKNLYTGTFTSEGAEGIYLYSFNEETGELTYKKVFTGIDNPSFIKISPDRNFLYAAVRPAGEEGKQDGYIYSYRIDESGELIFINRQLSNGADPCHIDISSDGKYVAVATYGSGTMSLYELNNDGSLREASSTIRNTGSGLNPSRQNAPHAHSVLFSEDGRQLFGADLGTDRLYIFNVQDQKLTPAEQPYIAIAPGAGPRHFAIHPRGNTMYVINELNSTISAIKRRNAKWETFQTISTVPDGFDENNYCADIHISPDGKFLYGSNRGHNSIAVYSIDPKTGQIEWITSVPTRGAWPRNFTLSKNGKFLLAANQRSGNIVVFKINNQTGIPEFSGHEVKTPSPVCLDIQ